MYDSTLTMKKKYFILLISCLLIVPKIVFAQIDFPNFLEGTWKMEGKEIYERWDLLNNTTMKGVSYVIDEGQTVVFEYLEMQRNKKNVVYTATVPGQNQGKSIAFKMKTPNDDTFTFENSKHDFPKKIVYQRLNNTEISVQVSGKNKNGFSYKMLKQTPKQKTENTSSNPNYDADLAEKLGSDDYGMKNYVLVILKTGTTQSDDREFINTCFRGHLDNINRLVAEKKMVVAGPFDKNENNFRGIFILDNIASLEEAKTLMQTDPAIKAGLLDIDLYTWYGSAALPEYLPISDKIWKQNP